MAMLTHSEGHCGIYLSLSLSYIYKYILRTGHFLRVKHICFTIGVFVTHFSLVKVSAHTILIWMHLAGGVPNDIVK